MINHTQLKEENISKHQETTDKEFNVILNTLMKKHVKESKLDVVLFPAAFIQSFADYLPTKIDNFHQDLLKVSQTLLLISQQYKKQFDNINNQLEILNMKYNTQSKQMKQLQATLDQLMEDIEI
jgi:predicted transcriptional regulator